MEVYRENLPLKILIMLKKIIFICILNLFADSASAQIAIGKQSIEGDGIWDFAFGDKRGIILPYTSSVTTPVSGTFVFDVLTNKVKYYSNGIWTDMTDTGSSPISVNSMPETADNGVIIGEVTTAKGVLVLESSSKALILPKISNASIDIYNPASGTICYDLSLDAIAIFNGSVWSYWK
jgi:hypothetical protein